MTTRLMTLTGDVIKLFLTCLRTYFLLLDCVEEAKQLTHEAGPKSDSDHQRYGGIRR